MDSAPIIYEDSWWVDAAGADPHEPADPWQEPAGRLHFSYRGSELALLLAVGDYWGYLYVTVDGGPANQLPHLPHNRSSTGQEAGYRTFYAPEAVVAAEPVAQWVPIHRATDPTAIHEVVVEVWRSWGQTPLRGVAVDALPQNNWPQWPGVALLLLSVWFLVPWWIYRAPPLQQQWQLNTLPLPLSRWLLPSWGIPSALPSAAVGLVLIVLAVRMDLWPATLVGLLFLAWAGVQRPALWISAFLFGLPFYFTFSLPLLPGRAIGLVDVGILGGVVITLLHWLLSTGRTQLPQEKTGVQRAGGDWLRQVSGALLAAIVCWALLATMQATHQAVAWREWRTVFLYAGIFGLSLALMARSRRNPTGGYSDQTLLLSAWLAGSTVVALVALWQYGSDTLLVQAEGVRRVRAFYGSPNNLALYLERTLAVTLALGFFAEQQRYRWIYLAAGLAQAAALLLTFSKGALLLALPVQLGLLWLGGWYLLSRRGESRRVLWWLAAVAVAIFITLLPFLGTERFQRLLDFEEGTGFVRLQLWQSSFQMALDHPGFGVGPDNFLYAYRSQYLLPAAWQEPNLNHPHNWLLDWWTRLGVPGLFLATSWFGLISLRQWWHLRSNHQAVLALGLLAATAAALAHGLIDASYALPDLIVVWVLMSYLPE
ncbi:MAG TPA: O-antigen ligase family protein [Caldilineaceae bacterium]|nr:O-antigen ligase family protein [Caldilineaceae bacterium]